ncbi:MAG: ABC transporter permease [Clostridia bacterium]|nr:ABC transporter permease [Clostridia bacterium]
MLKFALKNMAVRRARLLLVMLSIVISAGVALLSYNVSRQVNDGIVSTAAYYDMILGPSGSATQLAMNTMFFTDEPLGTIPYSYVEELERSGLTNAVIPFTMGDSYMSARIVGATPAFLDGKPLASGDMFSDVFEAVVGSEVARAYGLKVGDEIITSHGLNTTGVAHTASPLKITGVLRRTGTAYDNAVFTSYRTVWAVHGSEEHDHEDEDEDDDHDHEHEDDDHDHEHEASEGEVCAILVRSKGFNEYYRLSAYYGENAQLLCINPSTVLRGVLEQVDLSTKIVYLLCGVILIMNIIVISVITLLNLFDAKKEISLMRLIGVSMRRIAQLYLIQNSITGLCAVVLAMLMSHGCLALMSGLAARMGIVLSVDAVYAPEWGIAALVFVISVLPTMACILRMSARESLPT